MGRRIGRRRSEILRYFPYMTRRHWDVARRTAGRAVAAAIAHGDLVKQPCERCGRKRGVEAHHENYHRPLDVMWLCRVHHAARHAELREQAARLQQLTKVKPEPVTPVPVASMLQPRAYHSHIKDVDVTRELVEAVTLTIAEAMDVDGVNCNALAGRLGCSRQAIGNVFSGGVRSLRTLAGIANALGYDVHFSISKRTKSEAA